MNDLSCSPGEPTTADPWPAIAAPATPLHELFDLVRIDATGLGAELAAHVEARRLRKGGTLFHEGSHVERVHFIRAGTSKVFHTDADGYEQVLGFAGRAAVLGLDALGLDGHPTTAVALEDSVVLHVDPRGLRALRARCPAFDAALERVVSAQLSQLSELAELMAAVAAEVRLARFLLQLSTRMRRQGESGSRLLLRMSRRDIASFLGVAIETVSRSFALLAQEGYLRVDKRDIEIVDLDGLRDGARATRTPADRGSRSLTRRARLAAMGPCSAAMFA
jgi:CRP/FNR family transcriptional regulator